MSSKSAKALRRTAKKYTIQITKNVMKEINTMKFTDRLKFAWHTVRGNLGRNN